MGRVIRLLVDEHSDLQDLLPWYVTGRLDAAERAQLEAHLAGCADCQAEVRFQRQLEAEVKRMPVGVDESWARMRRRLKPDLASVIGGWLRGLGDGAGALVGLRAGGTTVLAAWPGAAMGAVVVATMGVLLLAPPGPARYHALGAAPAPAAGNVVVIFRPDVREREMRAVLNAGQARLVDGPTAADAYVLHVPAAQRAAILAEWRQRPDIVLAEPIDNGAAP